MQAELEKWLSKHTDEMEHTDRQGTIIGYTEVVTVADLRALLAGKVLCNPEVIGWRTERLSGEGCGKSCCVLDAATYNAESDDFWLSPGIKAQHRIQPLYAPASPMGNADIGKEGGE